MKKTKNNAQADALLSAGTLTIADPSNVTIDEGFKGNASLFKYARDLGNRRGDMYEIGLWEDSIVESGNDIMFAINIPQESVTIPETMDAIRGKYGKDAIAFGSNGGKQVGWDD